MLFSSSWKDSSQSKHLHSDCVKKGAFTYSLRSSSCYFSTCVPAAGGIHLHWCHQTNMYRTHTHTHFIWTTFLSKPCAASFLVLIPPQHRGVLHRIKCSTSSFADRKHDKELTEKKYNLQFFIADVRRLKSLAVRLLSRGVTMATPHGVKLRPEELVEPAPLFHPKHTHSLTSTHFKQHMSDHCANTNISQLTNRAIRPTNATTKTLLSPPSFAKHTHTQGGKWGGGLVLGAEGLSPMLEVKLSSCLRLLLLLLIQCQCVYASFVWSSTPTGSSSPSSKQTGRFLHNPF